MLLHSMKTTVHLEKNKQKSFISASKDNTGDPLGNPFFRQRYGIDGFTLSLNHSCNHLVTIKHLGLIKDVQGRKQMGDQ